MFRKNFQSGFTLLELLVVVAIIAILAGAIIVNLNRARGEANDARIQSDLRSVSDAIQLYVSTGGAASDLQGSNYSTSLIKLTQGANPLIPGGALPTHPGAPTYTYKYSGTASGGLLDYRLEGHLTAGSDSTECFIMNNGSPTTGGCTL